MWRYVLLIGGLVLLVLSRLVIASPDRMHDWIRQLQNAHAAARVAAVRALAQQKKNTAPAVIALSRALSDPNEEVRREAALALAKIGSASAFAVPRLIPLLGPTHSLALRSAAADALGAIGPDAAAAIPALLQALGDHLLQMRISQALFQIGVVAIPDLQRAQRVVPPAARQAVVQLLQRLRSLCRRQEKTARKEFARMPVGKAYLSIPSAFFRVEGQLLPIGSTADIRLGVVPPCEKLRDWRNDPQFLFVSSGSEPRDTYTVEVAVFEKPPLVVLRLEGYGEEASVVNSFLRQEQGRWRDVSARLAPQWTQRTLRVLFAKKKASLSQKNYGDTSYLTIHGKPFYRADPRRGLLQLIVPVNSHSPNELILQTYRWHRGHFQRITPHTKKHPKPQAGAISRPATRPVP
jgi:hypothetical protein